VKGSRSELTVDKKIMYDHFSKIASKYRTVRTTDTKPILHIKNRLNGKTRINIADVGCGDGRYSLELLRCLSDDCFLHCIDTNEDMLSRLEDYLTEQNTLNFCVRQGDANKLPLESDSMDCIVTFNAIHHFDIQKFLGETSRSLKEDGHLFIYTRLKNQNSRSIWGKYFPLFTEIENRLYELDKLKSYIQQADMKIYSTKVFGYHRASSLERLVEQAKNKHYSTFEFYDGTFGNYLDEFRKNILKNYEDMDNVTWQDENILLEIRK